MLAFVLHLTRNPIRRTSEVEIDRLCIFIFAYHYLVFKASSYPDIRTVPRLPVPSAPNVLFDESPEETFHVRDWVRRIRQRIKPTLLQNRRNDLVHHGVTQLLLAREVMKQRTLSGPCHFDDVIEATTLETVFVELRKCGSRNLPSRGLRCFGRTRDCLHTETIQTSRYVYKDKIRTHDPAHGEDSGGM